MTNRSPQIARRRTSITSLCLFAIVVALTRSVAGQTPPDDRPPLDAKQTQTNLSQRFERLELLAGRLAELSQSTQPRRAKLLRELVAQSRQRDVQGTYQEIVKQLERGRYSTAVDAQQQLHGELRQLLELLLQEDRDRQIESQRKRVSRYLQELKKLIRKQRGVAARTEGGDDAEQLSDDQERVENETGELVEQIESAEGAGAQQAASDAKDSKEKPAQSGNPSQDTPSADRQEGIDGESGEDGAESSPSEKTPEDSEDSQEGQRGPSGQSGENQSGENQSGENQSGESQSGESQSGESQSGGEAQESSPSNNEPQSPAERAVQALKKAQQRMQQAQERLDKAQRSGAAEEQQEAVRELEQAKAELEKILRQLREEEMERLLVLLEARFRKMLDMQVEVYDETQQLEASQETSPVHELEIAGGRLSRQEQQIVREADRALTLLREDGTSVAFPEALEQARADMQTISLRLAEVKVSLITQGLEEDVIAALEETLAALQQALAELREQRARQQQGSGQPGEQRLVDRLAELRMIRALQVRVNNRTERYAAMIDGEQAEEADLLAALKRLAEREERIFEATNDLHTGRNQ